MKEPKKPTTISEDNVKAKISTQRGKIIIIKREESLPELWDNIKPSIIHEIKNHRKKMDTKEVQKISE